MPRTHLSDFSGRKKRERSREKSEMSVSALISNIALHSPARVVCPSNTIIISIISRSRDRGTSEYPIRVASRPETDCHRPFHVVLLILDQRSRRKKSSTHTHQSQCGTNALLPYRNQYRYRVAYAGYFAIYFQPPLRLPFIRFVIRFITPSITRHSY